MTFERGMAKPAGSGRKLGQVNPHTHRFRVAMSKLLEMNEKNFTRWLSEIADGCPEKDLKPDPKGALDIVAKLAEYAAPKLARTEVVGDGGGPVGLVVSATREDQNL